jgi:hypothetical protein
MGWRRLPRRRGGFPANKSGCDDSSRGRGWIAANRIEVARIPAKAPTMACWPCYQWVDRPAQRLRKIGSALLHR